MVVKTAVALADVVVHEAGHAVIGVRLGMPLARISLRWEGDDVGGYGIGGYTEFSGNDAELSDYLAMLLAGETAVEMILGHRSAMGPHLDSDEFRIREAVSAAGWIGERDLPTAKRKARRLVRAHRQTIAKLADALIEVVNRTMENKRWSDLDVSVEGGDLAALLESMKQRSSPRTRVPSVSAIRNRSRSKVDLPKVAVAKGQSIKPSRGSPSSAAARRRSALGFDDCTFMTGRSMDFTRCPKG